MKPTWISSCVIGIILALPSLGSAQLAGKYSDGKLTAEFLDAAAGTFSGTLTLGGQQFAATAHAATHGFEGTFNSVANTFSFTAALDGDTLALTTGGASYALKRVTPQNPLAAPQNPLAAAARTGHGDGPLAGYTIEASTDGGKSLMAQKPNASSVQAALEATFPDLAKYFGARPDIGRAYEDARDHKSGGATFTVKMNGQPIAGFASCRLIEGHGASVAVIFDRADATKADWDKLTTPAADPPPAQAAPVTDDAKVLGNDSQVYQFPDGTGYITLAAGWKTQADSAIHPIFIVGPHDQNIAIGNIINVQTPDSPLMKMIAQNEATMRRMGGNLPPRQPILVADFTDPIQAMTDLSPQLSKMNEAHGLPSLHLDKIVSHEDVACDLKDGKAAIVSWDVTRTLHGNSAQYRGLATVQMGPIVPGTWMYCFTGFTAPQATFEQDKPIMDAMMQSIHVDPQMASQRMQEQNQQQMAMLKQQADNSAAQLQQNHDQFMHDQAQRFADGQARHAAQMAGYQKHNDQWAADELQKSRSNADFVETIKGTRTIYDTQTGATGTADLNYSTGVVNQLNEAALDPNRFVQIPLRDEMYPMPGAGGR